MPRKSETKNLTQRRTVRRLATLEKFTLPEYMRDPDALDFIDLTASGLSEEEIREAAKMPAEELDANDDEDGEPFDEDDAIASGEQHETV
ncbi:MAG TPA: hypothetical protein VGT08_01160 [Terracidiphilus sp.]|nr:hypothetical protein [Terracidiphilus sp.]